MKELDDWIMRPDEHLQADDQVMTKLEVVKAWIEGKGLRSGNLRTDGVSLWSYELKIGFTAKDDFKYIHNNYTAMVNFDCFSKAKQPVFVSMTTPRFKCWCWQVQYSG